MNGNSFKNGNARSNTGYRQVLFASNGDLRPVLATVDSGYAPDCGTVQVAPVTSDWIARIEWNSGSERFTVSKVTENGDCYGEPLSWSDAAPVWELLKKIHPWLDGWLDRVSRGSSYLPDGAYGGESIVARAKRQRIESALKR